TACDQAKGISGLAWALPEPEAGLLGFPRALPALRREHPVFRRRRFFLGHPAGDGHLADIAWLMPSGREMGDADWSAPGRAMTVFLNGDALTEPAPHGERVRDDSFLLMLSADREPLEFTAPDVKYGERWTVVAGTAADGPADPAGSPEAGGPEAGGPEVAAGDRVTLTGNSMVVLRRCPAGEGS